MAITIKRRGPGDYYVAENENIAITNASVAWWGDSEAENVWTVYVDGNDDHTASFKRKRDAVADAEILYNHLKNK